MNGVNIKILIVGAGPTGLTAAVELARQGIIPSIIDRRSEASGLSRAVGIMPSSLKLLTPSGVTDRLLKSGPAMQGICGYFNSKKLLSLNFPEHLPASQAESDQAHLQIPLHCLPQDKTEAILATRFAELSGHVQYGVEFIGLTQNTDSVTVTTTNGEKNYDYVIGADGIGSQVRKQLDVAYSGYDLDEPWSVADVDTIDWKHPQEFSAFLMTNGNVCIAAPIGENRVRFVSNTKDALNTLPIDVGVQNIRRQSTFTISVRQVTQYSVNRVHLAGDAAHCHSPVGGRGMNLGIADAALLAECLATNTCDDYHRLRQAEAKRIIAMTERARRFLISGNRISKVVKPVALRTINKSDFIKRRIVLGLLAG